MLAQRCRNLAWLRGKDREPGPTGQPPTAPRAPRREAALQLPVLTEEGITSERDASKRLRRAEADIRRLERREAKARKQRERELRGTDRRLARRERSKHVGPARMMATLTTLNGVAVAIIMLFLWWPDQPLYDPVLYRSNVHYEVVIWCFVASSVVGLLLLSRNPSADHQDRARSSLQLYFSLGLISVFSGLLLTHVLEQMELMAVDWLLWTRVLLFILAGSGSSMAVIYAAARWGRSRSFLSAGYHWAMGTLTTVLAVALVLLPFMLLPHLGWMYEVGTSLTWAGWLMMAFAAPLLAGTFVVTWQETRHLSGLASD